MAATKTLAFILKKQDYRDTSLLADLYTRDHGKVKGIIKGIRETPSRFGSTLEPFSLNEILFYKRRRGGDLHQVTQVELLDSFPLVREDLERLAYGSYFAELVDDMVEAEQAEPEIFDLLKDSLDFLGSGASCKRAARIFEVKLLDILGFMPQIGECVICRTQLPDPTFFSVQLGGIFCKPCAEKRQASGTGIPVSRGTLNFLEHVMRSDIKDLRQVKVAQEVGTELEKMLRRFVDFHLPYKLNSIVFLEKMGFN